MFVKFIKNTILFKIIFIMTLTHQTIFAECFYDCCDYCRLFCNCCYSDIIIEKDEELTPQILKHLKLEGEKIKDIVNEINNIQDNEEKIKKIIEYSKDIDWENECCPNTLIRWENNECAYIAYFHLMLNNPYFLKFFLICDKTMRRKDTYVLNAICECVKWCIYHPSFNKNNMGSVDGIMKAFFRKENGEYYYLEKNKNNDNLRNFYYGIKEIDIKEHHYGSYLPESVYFEVNLCLKIDLSINGLDTEEEIEEKIKDIIVYKTESIYPYSINRILNGQKVDEEKYQKIQIKKNKDYEGLSGGEEKILEFEGDVGKCKKILGIWIYQWHHHFYAFTKNKDFWYNKNTLKINAIGQKDRGNYMLPFMNAISKNVGPTKEEEKIKGEIYQEDCHFIYIQ